MADRLENVFTRIYSKAGEERVPARYIYYRGMDQAGNFYLLNAQREIEHLLARGLNLLKAYYSFKDVIRIDEMDMAYLYLTRHNDSEGLEVVNKYIDACNKTKGRSTLTRLDYDEMGEIQGLRGWLNHQEEELEKDRETLDKHLTFINQFDAIPQRLPIFKFNVNESTNHYYVVKSETGERLTMDDGFEIFNKSIANEVIQAISWQGEGFTRYKTFEQVNKALKIVDYTDTEISFYIYDQKKSNFYQGNLNLRTSVLTIKSRQGFEKIIEENFINCFDLDIRAVDIQDIKGEMLTQSFPYNIVDIFLQMFIMNNKLYRNFYFTDTKQTNNIGLNFRGFRGNGSYYRKGYVSTSFNIKISFDDVVEFENNNAQMFLIQKATSMMELQSFAAFFSRLMGSFFQEREQLKIKELFRYYIYSHIYTDDTDTIISSLQLEQNNQIFIPTSKIKLLTQKNPEMFRFNYARAVDCKKQPIIIDEDEVEAWKNLKIEKNGVVEGRTVIKFPPDSRKGTDPQFYYVCPSDTYPYITFTINKAQGKEFLSEEQAKYMKKYPYIIKCGHVQTDLENLENYTMSPKKKSISQHETTTFKLRHFGQQGKIFPSILSFLEKIYKGKKLKANFSGSDISGASFLQAALILMGVDFSNNERKRLNHLNDARLKIAQEILPETLKQEMYDYSDKSIKKMIAEDPYFSSELYYRAVEEALDVNIVIFRPKEMRRGIKTTAELEIIIETPRFTQYHIRHFDPQRQTLFIYKSMGSEVDNISTPHYQAIQIENPEDIDNRLLQKLLNETSASYLWSYESDQEFKLERNYLDLKCRLNPTFKLDWQKILKADQSEKSNITLLSQNLDGYGKLRGINFKYQDRKVTILTLPCAPLNLPYSDKIYKIDNQLCYDLFGEPVGAHEEGYWYRIADYNYGVFVPVEDQVLEAQEYPTPFIAVSKTKNSRYHEYINFKKSASLLLDTIEWIWYHDRVQYPTFEAWWEEFSQVSESEEVAQSKPRWEKVSIFFPDSLSSIDSIRAIQDWWPEIFGNDKITVTEKLDERIKMYFNKVERDTVGLPNFPNYYISSMVKGDIEFENSSNLSFIGSHNLRKWIELKNKDRKNIIQTSIDLGKVSTEPIIYRDVNSKVYLVQKLAIPTEKNAIFLCHYWQEKGENLGHGFQAENIPDDDVPAFVVYQINDKGKIVPIQRVYNSEIYCSIINYNGNEYAALLEIL